jgi:hypothetical protein
MPHFSNVFNKKNDTHIDNLGLNVFKIVVMVTVQNIFRLKIHQNIFFLFFKN